MKKILPIYKEWSPSSWKKLPIKQAPEWPKDKLTDAIQKLKSFPPLVSMHEIDTLKKAQCYWA